MNWPSLAFARQGAEAMWLTRSEKSRLLIVPLGNFLNCRPLFPDLSVTVVPFSFQMLFDAVEDSCLAVAEKAMPVFRFGKYLREKVDASVVLATVRSSRNLPQVVPLSPGAGLRRVSPDDREDLNGGGQTCSLFQALWIRVSRPDRPR